jgi:hypothetical protein
VVDAEPIGQPQSSIHVFGERSERTGEAGRSPFNRAGHRAPAQARGPNPLPTTQSSGSSGTIQKVSANPS